MAPAGGCRKLTGFRFGREVWDSGSVGAINEPQHSHGGIGDGVMLSMLNVVIAQVPAMMCGRNNNISRGCLG